MDDLKFRAKIAHRRKDEPSILEGGLLKIQFADHTYAQLMASKLKGYDGRVLQFEVSDGDSWSDRMNALFHTLVRKIISAGATNYWSKIGRAPETFEEVKSWIKIELGGAKIETVGQLTWIESWTKFSKKRAMQTIDNVIHYCIENSVDIDAEKLEDDSLGE